MKKSVPKSALSAGTADENMSPGDRYRSSKVDQAMQRAATACHARGDPGKNIFRPGEALGSATLVAECERDVGQRALERIRQIAVLLARQAAAEDDAAERQKGAE